VRNNIANGTEKLDASISINIYYSFDEEEGYYLDTDSIRNEFELEMNLKKH
jgi:hypothetical protein